MRPTDPDFFASSDCAWRSTRRSTEASSWREADSRVRLRPRRSARPSACPRINARGAGGGGGSPSHNRSAAETDRTGIPLAGMLHLLVIYIIWGSTYLAIRVAVREGSGFPPFTMGALRTLIGGGILPA